VSRLDDARRGRNQASQADDLEALRQLAMMQPDPVAFPGWLAERLRAPSDPLGVTLATVHRVKGQEWPLVVVHHADAQQFPHRLSEDVEEERRVFHVAVTRTSAELVIVTTPTPSPFVAELTGERPAPSAPSPSRHSPSPPARPTELPPLDAAVFEDLRVWRAEVAKALGVPAYVVGPDKLLRELAARRPATLADLARVPGIGPAKLQQHGEAILARVAGAVAGFDAGAGAGQP
jgi:DNA helicase-2/ATP-dependent DNA helicase PcrA